ncbi:MAG: hypothetical protein ACXWQE_12810 [Bdellovibrionales bacterium]
MNKNNKSSHKHLYPPEVSHGGPTDRNGGESINVETDHKEWPYGYFHPHREEIFKKESKGTRKPEQSKKKKP